MSRRDQIAMPPAEVAAFLEERRVVICASNGVRGWPHLMPLWYLIRGEGLWAWTYARSQKVRNLERDPRATLQVEAGVQYHELRGVMVQAQTVIHRELGPVGELGGELLARYGGVGQTRRPVRRSGHRRPSGWPSSSARSGPRAGITASLTSFTDPDPVRAFAWLPSHRCKS